MLVVSLAHLSYAADQHRFGVSEHMAAVAGDSVSPSDFPKCGK